MNLAVFAVYIGFRQAKTTPTFGSRNTALQELVCEIRARLVAEMLGYSDQVTQRHAAEAGNTWAKYVKR